MSVGYVPVTRLLKLKRESGVTLLEGLLVIAIMSSIILLGINQFQQYKNQSNALNVRYLVDKLFVAAAHYYQAYCSDRGSGFSPAIYMNSGIVPVEINVGNLVGTFLTDGPQPNPLIDSNVGYRGYYLVYFPAVGANRTMYACYNPNSPASKTVAPCAAPIMSRATVWTWRIQVSIKMASPGEAASYQGLLGADCASDNYLSCSSGTGTKNYLIWSRPPSYASPNMNSLLWLSTPRVNQFNAQYTHDVQSELMFTGSAARLFYVCGGY